MKTSTTTEIEYEDAPCGYVTFYNYKEPLMKFEGGYGFVGALVFDGVSDKIQCHFCGEWFDTLGNHIMREHSLRADEYKRTVGLNVKTALINEKIRSKLIAKGLERRIKNLVNQKGIRKSLATRRKISATLKEHRDETKNKTGTCPEQLLTRLHELYLKLGRTPKHNEIVFSEAVERTYGSIKEAYRLLDIPYRQPGQTTQIGISKEDVLSFLSDFYKKHNRFPKMKECAEFRNGIARYGGLRELRIVTLKEHETYLKAPRGMIVRHSREQLLRMLCNFEKINGRKPSYSDCKRGLLPVLSRYSYNFGSWKNALALAFPKT